MGVKEALSKLDKKTLKKNLMKIGFTGGAIDAAFSRGVIPKKMGPDMETFTSVPCHFWIYPDIYNVDGSRK